MNDNCARKRIYVNQLEIDVFHQRGMYQEQFISQRPIQALTMTTRRSCPRAPPRWRVGRLLQAFQSFTDILGLLRGRRGRRWLSQRTGACVRIGVRRLLGLQHGGECCISPSRDESAASWRCSTAPRTFWCTVACM
jgi:hypothetical protein